MLSATNPFAVPTIKGRLLTPEEGCGHSKVLTKRIVGGSAAKNGIPKYISSIIRSPFEYFHQIDI